MEGRRRARSSTARSTASAQAVARQRASVLRRLQTGSVRAYAASLFLGVVLILGVLPVALTRCVLMPIVRFCTLARRAAGGRRPAAALRPRRRAERSAPLVRNIALVVSLLVFAETLLLWSALQPGVGGLPVRRAPRLDSGVRHQLLRRRRRHQPAAARADRLPDAAGAARLVGVGAQADARRSASSCCCSRAR